MQPAVFYRTGRAGPEDFSARVPELVPLRQHVVAIFGLGAIGAPIALELARAGVGSLRLVDWDFVDPATMPRWPLGLEMAGRAKVKAIAETIRKNYPFTTVESFQHRLGVVRHPELEPESELDLIERVSNGTSLIIDATAEVGVQHFLSDTAAESGIPYIGIDASPGAWGGRICRIRPQKTKGCWMCYRSRLLNNNIPSPPEDPRDDIQPAGCGDPTFVGAGFDLVATALLGVRLTVSTLCEGVADGYPPTDWDVAIVSYRNNQGHLISPTLQTFALEPHSECPKCGTP
jgi:molybdopterin/thiamine biosynthesis adenylyltransferase